MTLDIARMYNCDNQPSHMQTRTYTHILKKNSPHRSDLSVSVDVRAPKVNASSGAVVGMRVDQGGCTAFVAKGIFMFLDVSRQTVELALDLG